MGTIFRYLLLMFATLANSGLAWPGFSSEFDQWAYARGTPCVLFDGTSLDGWAKADGQRASGWVLQDGCIHRAEGGGDLYYQSSFRDFELYFQWKISAGGNSGVKYRVRKYGNQWLGCEYQILDDGREKNRKHITGALYAVYEPSQSKPVIAPGRWYQSKIVVCGNRLEHWLDGQLIVAAEVGSPDWTSRVQTSKFADKNGIGENREGRIFLQDHGNPVWFRHIVLVPLNCDLPCATRSAQATGFATCQSNADTIQSLCGATPCCQHGSACRRSRRSGLSPLRRRNASRIRRWRN